MRGPHDHLNTTDPVQVTLTMDELAERVICMNHGAPRILAAISRALRKRGREADRGLIEGLERLTGTCPAPLPPGITPLPGKVFRTRCGPIRRVRVLSLNADGTCNYSYITVDGRQDFRRRGVITGNLRSVDWEPELVPAALETLQ